MAGPDLLITDDPAIMLSPIMFGKIEDMIVDLNRRRETSRLMVEQNALPAVSKGDTGDVIWVIQFFFFESAYSHHKQGPKFIIGSERNGL